MTCYIPSTQSSFIIRYHYYSNLSFLLLFTWSTHSVDGSLADYSLGYHLQGLLSVRISLPTRYSGHGSLQTSYKNLLCRFRYRRISFPTDTTTIWAQFERKTRMHKVRSLQEVKPMLWYQIDRTQPNFHFEIRAKSCACPTPGECRAQMTFLPFLLQVLFKIPLDFCRKFGRVSPVFWPIPKFSPVKQSQKPYQQPD